MKKRFRLVLLTALLTGIGIAAFQLVWLQKTWAITKNNFYTTASSLLQKSVNDYHNQDIRRMLNQQLDSLYVAPDSPAMHPLHEALLSTSQPDVVEQAIANLTSKAPKIPLNLNALKKLYQQELLLNKITLPLTLYRDTLAGTIPMHDTAYAILNSSTRKTRVTAVFSNITPWLIRQNAWPIGISASLILLTACSLVYMLRVIKRQQQLDIMKNDFINNITHELRTPVTILRSTHEAIDRFGYINDPERTLRYLQANMQVLDQMDANIDRILQIAKYESNPVTSPTQINLRQLLITLTQRFAAEDRVAVILRYQLPAEEVYIDAGMLETIVSSLIDNAVKYSERPAEINVLVTTAPGGMLLEVKDNGIGIAAANLPYIFDRFYRVPTGNIHNVKGYGIGLHYVQTLTRLLGGNITVKSKPGAGTCFRIQLPLS